MVMQTEAALKGENGAYDARRVRVLDRRVLARFHNALSEVQMRANCMQNCMASFEMTEEMFEWQESKFKEALKMFEDATRDFAGVANRLGVAAPSDIENRLDHAAFFGMTYPDFDAIESLSRGTKRFNQRRLIRRDNGQRYPNNQEAVMGIGRQAQAEQTILA